VHQRRSQHPLLKLLDTAPRDLAVLAIRMLQVRSTCSKTSAATAPRPPTVRPPQALRMQS